MNDILIVGFCTLLVIFIINKLHKNKLNEPPVVPYKYPLICHTWDFESDTKNFLLKCRKEFGEIFTINVNGVSTTVVGKELGHEVFNSKNASFRHGTHDRLPVSSILGLPLDSNVIPEMVKTVFISQVYLFSDKIQQSFLKDVDELIGECKEPKEIGNPYQTLLTIVSKAVTPILVGDKLSQDKELINIFRDFSDEAHQLLKAPRYLGYIHPWVYQQSIILKFMWGDNQIKKIRNTVIEKIKPVVEERLKQEREYGDSWKRPVDSIQYMLDCPMIDKENVDYNWISGSLLATTLAAMSTTVMAGSNFLLDLSTKPEYWNDLLEEQENVNPNNNVILSLDQVSKMEKLDSFLKESLRLAGHEFGLEHKVMDTDFTFSNGYVVPKGRKIGIYLKNVHHDQENYGPDPDEFDGYRFLGKDSPASKVSRKFLQFGMGRHACPGRIFAINNIKLLASILMKKYKFTTKSGKRPSNLMFNGIAFPYPEPIIFEKRV